MSIAPLQPHKKRRESFKPKLDLPEESIADDLSLGLDKEFDRVIESSKVDYISLRRSIFDPFFCHSRRQTCRSQHGAW